MQLINSLASLAGFFAVAKAASYNGTTVTTEVVTAITTYCPSPTSFVFNGKSVVVTSATTLTITDCPCTIANTLRTSVTTLPVITTWCETTIGGGDPKKTIGTGGTATIHVPTTLVTDTGGGIKTKAVATRVTTVIDVPATLATGNGDGAINTKATKSQSRGTNDDTNPTKSATVTPAANTGGSGATKGTNDDTPANSANTGSNGATKGANDGTNPANSANATPAASTKSRGVTTASAAIDDETNPAKSTGTTSAAKNPSATTGAVATAGANRFGSGHTLGLIAGVAALIL